jgi:acyl-CoA synthetase (AMP-forming)/AMP-acid ligase II
MPSKQVWTVFIICAGLIISVWIFDRKTGVLTADLPTPFTPSSRPKIESADWQAILASTTEKNVTNVIAGKNGSSGESYPGEGTLTDQIAKDFFSRYLDAPKDSNGSITSDQADQIAGDVLASGSYSTLSGVVYTLGNLKISTGSSSDVVQKYYRDMTAVEKILLGINKSAFSIVDTAATNGDEAGLAELDSIIAAYRQAKDMMLSITAPADAAQIHLADINSVSQMLADVEAMRNTFSDPVKAFVAINQYNGDSINFSNAVKATVNYFIKKGFSAPAI